MNMLDPSLAVEHARGPWSLPFKRRVVYETADCLDATWRVGSKYGPDGGCCMERHLLHTLRDALDIREQRPHETPEQYLAAIPPEARQLLRDALIGIWEDHAGDRGQEWCLYSEPLGYQGVHRWRQEWISEYVRMRDEPNWVRRYWAAVTSPEIIAKVSWGILGFVGGTLVGHLR